MGKFLDKFAVVSLELEVESGHVFVDRIEVFAMAGKEGHRDEPEDKSQDFDASVTNTGQEKLQGYKHGLAMPMRDDSQVNPTIVHDRYEGDGEAQPTQVDACPGEDEPRIRFIMSVPCQHVSW